MPDDLTPSGSSPDSTPARVESEFERRLAVFVGPRWEKSYRKKLKPFLEDASFVPTWNWAAALGAPFWFLYRKMYWYFLVFFFAPSLLLPLLVPGVSDLKVEEWLLPGNEQVLLVNFGVQISLRLASGGLANWLLFRRASTAIRVVDMRPMATGDSMQLLRRVGGVSRGLTLGIVLLFFVLALASAAGSVVPG